MARFSKLMSKLAAVLTVLVINTVGASAQQVDPANPYGFEKKAVNADGTPYVGPPNVGDTINYVLTYKPGTASSGPVTIEDQLSPNLSYTGPTTSSPGWTWGSSPYATGNKETYVNTGFGPNSVTVKVSGLPLAQPGNGDGTVPIPIASLGKVFGVFHHEKNARVACWNLNDLTSCGSAVANPGIETPFMPHAAVIGSRIYFAGKQGSAGAIGCFDASGNVPCGVIAVGGNAPTYESVGGVVMDAASRLYTVVEDRVFCNDATNPALPVCAGWPAAGFQAIASPPPFGGGPANIAIEQSPSPSRIYMHHGNGIVQCVNISGSGPSVCSNWPAAGVALPLSGNSGMALSSIPASGSTGDGGICLWTEGVASTLAGCVDFNSGTVISGASPTQTSPTTPRIFAPFRLPGTGRVYFPKHSSSEGPACFDYTGSNGSPCAGFTSSTPSWVGPTDAMQYGFAVDPLKPDRCMLALGDSNLLWRFDYNTGEVGCGTDTYATPAIDSLFCSGTPDPAKFKWTSAISSTAGTAGTLVIKQGTTMVYTGPVSMAAVNFTTPPVGSTSLTVTYTPSAGAPATIDLHFTYTSDRDPDICYSAKVKECGVVSNTATMKGTFNNAVFSVPKTVGLGSAKGPDCQPVDPPDNTTSCFTPDIKVTCGKTPGTYVITLNANTGNGAAPTEVEITPLTPGVTIVNAAPVYQVNSNGQVVITIAGANPGDAIEFAVSGSRADPNSEDGMSICCVGTIKVEIPKDIACDIKPEVKVSKACLPAKPNGNGGYSAMCQITVTTTGAQPSPLTVLEGLSGTGTVTYVSATDPWVCAPASVTAPAPMSCTLPGNTLNPVSDTSVIDVKVDFPNKGAVEEAKNCAAQQLEAGATGPKSCVPFTIDDESTVEVEKKCEPATPGKYAVNPYTTGFGYISNCTITVTTTGPQTGTLSVGDSLTGGSLVSFGSTSTPAWSCSANICSIAGASLNQTSSISTFSAQVVFANPGAVQEGRNCAVVARDQTKLDKDCVTFETESEVSITKVCEPPTQLDSPVLQFGSKCIITVTTTGPVQSHLTVSDQLTGGGQVTSFTSTSTPAWTCTAGQCEIAGSSLNQTSSVSTFEAIVTFPPGQGADQAVATNCAKLGQDAHLAGEACDDIKVDDEPFRLDVNKVCNQVTELQSGGPWAVSCSITVTATGGPRPPVISISENLQHANTTITPPATLQGFQSADAWSCPPFGSGIPANTPVNCTIAGSSFPASGTSVINFQMFIPKGTKPGEAKNCVSAAAQQTPGVATSPPVGAGPVCVDLPGEDSSTQNVNKVCEPATVVVGAVNSYQSVCHITVTTTGPQTGTITVNDLLSGVSGPSITSIASTTTPAWSCSGTSCSITGSQLNQTSSTSVIDAVVSFPSAGHASEVQNCAKLAVDGADSGESCTGFTVGDGTKGRLTVLKEALFNDQHITNQSFPVTVTCGANTSNGTIADGTPYVQANIPVGTSCSVVEGASTPVSGLCPAGQAASWTTSYTPATPVAITAAGATITVTNKLACEPKSDGDVKITKVCDAATPGQTFQGSNGFHTVCHITVTTSGPIANPGLTVGDLVLPQSITPLIQQTGGPAWACSSYSCSASPAVLGNSSTSTFDAYIDFPDAGAVREWNNCASTAGAVSAKACTTYTIDEPKTGTLTVEKIALAGDQHITNQTFDMNLSCTSNSSQVIQVADGTPYVQTGIPVGSDCDVAEIHTATPAGLCPAGQTGSWVTSYAPNEGVTIPATGATITVTNRLKCEPTVKPETTFSVRKEVIRDGEPVTGTSFAMTVTCGKGNVQTIAVPAGQSVTIANLANGTSCHVVENPVTTSGLCPKGMTEQWSTSYVPANGTNTTSTLASVMVTVKNTLACVPVETGSLTIVKQAFYNGQHLLNQSFPVNLACGNNSQLVPVADGSPYTQTGIPVGTDCDVAELPASIPPLCAKGYTGSWKTSYAPSDSVTIPANGATITITNMLDCKKIDALSCPPGTFWTGNICLPNCPPLTAWDGTICKPTCPPLTQWNGTICQPTCPPLTQWDGTFCKPTCPPLTEWDGNICRPTCPPLTQWDGNICRPNCPPLTEWDGNICRPKCPPLTEWDGSICKPKWPFKTGNPTPETCKPGFNLVGDKCEPNRAKCDPRTAKLVEGECRCTVKGMRPISKTACGCPDGTQLKNGECRNNPPPPKDPVCGKNQRLVNHKCVNNPPPPCGANQRRNAAGKCVAIIPDCQAGTKWNGKRCVAIIPECKRGTHWNGKRCIADVPDCPPGTVFNGKRCVPRVVQCEPGQIRIGRRCVDKPRCARGQIALPGTGLCVDLKPRDPKPRDPKPGSNEPKGGDNCRDPATGRPIPCP